MLLNFINEFKKISLIENFEFNVILSDDRKTGNLLGEAILFSGVEKLSDLGSDLDWIFINGIFGYPFYSWRLIIESHPDFSYSECCQHILDEKLICCSRLWMERGFIVSSEGIDDSINTQVKNLKTFLNLGKAAKRELSLLTRKTLYLSGIFGAGLTL